MTDDNLTAAEQAFHDSRGETELPAESAAPEAKPEAVAEKLAPASEAKPEATGEKEPDVQKLVPHGAFEEERARRKAAQGEAATLREQLAFLKGQQESLNKGQKPEGMTPQEKADWDKDPIGAGKALQARLDAEKEQAEASKRQSEVEERIGAIGQRHAAKFAKVQPHYFDSKAADGTEVKGAYTFLREAAASVLAEKFPNATAAEIRRVVDLNELQDIEAAARDGDNIAERFWEMAIQHGYKPPVAAAPAAAAKPDLSEAAKVATKAAAQAAALSLSSAPGGSGEAELTMDVIAKMSEAEFNRLDPEKVRRVMGG